MSNRKLSHLTFSAVFKHGLLLGAGYLVGALNDAPWQGLCAALAMALAWHVFYRTRLQHWLQERPAGPIPSGGGDWPQVFARILHFRKRSTVHKERSERYDHIWQSFVDALPDAAFILNENFEIRACNQRAAELLDIEHPHLNGLITNFLRQPQLQKYLHSTDFKETVVITTPKAPALTLRCRLSRCDDTHLLLQLLDISEQVRAQQMRTDFVANASHELRTPVTVLKGYLDSFVDDEELPEQMRMPIHVMDEQIIRMEHLINDLMALNVLESGTPASLETVVDIVDVLHGVQREALATPFARADLQLDINSDTGIFGSTSDFHSIASNLVVNALRFTGDNGHVRVSWSTSTTGGQLIVEDTGIGIDEDDLHRVTERFYRTEAGKSRHQLGTGLGLAIVKHALARHEATLAISSEFGKGSVFTCDFPAHRLQQSPV